VNSAQQLTDVFVAYFTSQTEKKQKAGVWVMSPISIFKFTYIHKTSYKKGILMPIHFNFPQLEFTTWWMYKLVRRKRP
jgi:hypothetical protein